MRISDLRKKDVINTLDGKRLGFIRDIEIDVGAGHIRSLLLPDEPGGWWSFFGRADEREIPFEQIDKIGADVILITCHSFIKPDAARRRRKQEDEDDKKLVPQEERAVWGWGSDGKWLDFPDYESIKKRPLP